MWQFVESSMEHSSLVASVSSLLIMFVKNAILMSTSIRSVSGALVGLLAHDDSAVDGDVVALQPARRQCAGRSGGGARLSRHDVAAVMASLGLVVEDGDEEEEEEDDDDDEQECRGWEAVAAVEELTGSKVAGEDELREAFYVFDRDEDGYITATELWNVLRRLGMEKGAHYGDCVRMIAAQDGDGDGRVSFREFRAMMENAV
ncbi:hypothetical protein GUJ93_ZPchr0003g18263 [Zizania palustris]|uniref:EF-hand domain-containing protein n=1 Tax=Zizania palustris TaxID=103762 RepID=A0A8J5VWA0_ZIZPA|nr:hypothetical protein GUJ93_ZPchr0003g18263 [Zizania palustris]